MTTFTDSAGRTWQLNLTIDAVKRVRSLVGVNLLELEQGDPPLMTRLGLDVILLCDVIFAIVQPQAEAQGVSDTDFGAALGGEAIMAAHTAFYEALVNFTRSLGRSDTAQALTTQQQLVAMGVKQAEEKISAIDPEAVIEKALNSASGSLPES